MFDIFLFADDKHQQGAEWYRNAIESETCTCSHNWDIP